ncbi:S26 family signal peptidase [Leptospira neocaledonica]|nr:S26 family signal peptidase [Leptospira neocaledonica]
MIFVFLTTGEPDLNHFSFLIISIIYLILILTGRKNAKYVFAIIISISSVPFGLLYFKKFKQFGIFLTIALALPIVIIWSIYKYSDPNSFAIIVLISSTLYIVYFSALLFSILRGEKDKTIVSQTENQINLRLFLFSLYCVTISFSAALIIDFLYSEKLNIYMAKGSALEPNILDGDILIAKRDNFVINRGDVVLRSYEDSESLVRIIGIPGDNIECIAKKNSSNLYHMEIFINNVQLPIELNYNFQFKDWENNTRPELVSDDAYNETIDGHTYQIIVPTDDIIHKFLGGFPNVLPNHFTIQLENEEYYLLPDDRQYFCYFSLIEKEVSRSKIGGKLIYRIFSFDWANKNCRDSKGKIKPDSKEYCEENLWPRIHDSKFRYDRIGPI